MLKKETPPPILIDALILYCKKRGISVRKLVKQTGMAHGTAANFLKGKPLDSDNLARLLIWALQPSQPTKDAEKVSEYDL